MSMTNLSKLNFVQAPTLTQSTCSVVIGDVIVIIIAVISDLVDNFVSTNKNVNNCEFHVLPAPPWKMQNMRIFFSLNSQSQ